MTGIDVSKHNGHIDWQKVKAAGVDFVIIRAGYGRELSQKDSLFEENYRGAKAAGLKVGAYWYSYATTGEDAIKEARTFLQVVQGKQFEFPLYFDIEEENQMVSANILISAFCNEIEKAGYFAGFYASKSVVQNYVSTATRERYSLWVAEWQPVQHMSAPMWQRSASERVDGIDGYVDANVCHMDFEPIIRERGLNGFEAEQTTGPTEKEEIPIRISMNGVIFEGSVKHANTAAQK